MLNMNVITTGANLSYSLTLTTYEYVPSLLNVGVYWPSYRENKISLCTLRGEPVEKCIHFWACHPNVFERP